MSYLHWRADNIATDRRKCRGTGKGSKDTKSAEHFQSNDGNWMWFRMNLTSKCCKWWKIDGFRWWFCQIGHGVLNYSYGIPCNSVIFSGQILFETSTKSVTKCKKVKSTHHKIMMRKQNKNSFLGGLIRTSDQEHSVLTSQLTAGNTPTYTHY